MEVPKSKWETPERLPDAGDDWRWLCSQKLWEAVVINLAIPSNRNIKKREMNNAICLNREKICGKLRQKY